MADALVSQLTTLSNSLKAEADKIDEATAKKLNDALIVLQNVARKASGDSPPFVTAYDDFLAEHLAKYLRLSGEIGGKVGEHAKLVEKCYNLQKEILQIAATSKRPPMSEYARFFAPLTKLVEDVVNFADQNRLNKEFQNHFMTVKEGIGCIGWVTVEPKPGVYLKEMYDQALFYGNRVIKDYKGKDDKQVEWMRSFISTIMKLKEYVDNYLPTSLTWNPQGKVAVSPGGSAAPPPPPPGGAPAPPLPPPVEASSAPGGAGGEETDSAAALFAEINKGADVTSGLKKVTADMQTHKNPTLRQSAQPFPGQPKGQPKSVSAPKGPVKAVVKPPRLELVDKKWEVEYQKDNKNVVIEGNMKQAVYIYKCEGSVIQVKNKVNSITMDNCKKTALVFDQCLGSVDTVNCQSVQLQVTGSVPIVNIDKTDGAMLYLSSESLKTVIVAAKSSEMNVLVPKGDGDYTEFALPEQYKSTYNGKTFVTECSESLG